MKTVCIVLGTRPEAIKLAPVVKAIARDGRVRATVCNTEQQKQLSHQALGFFGIHADFSLDAMKPNQTLAEIQRRLMGRLDTLFATTSVDAVMVQGDTLSAFCGALSAYFRKIPVFHLEAGLRSCDLYEPFPEEGLRQMIARLASLHFAPTQNNRQALLSEGIPEGRIVVTGNTVVDALNQLPPAMVDSARSHLEAEGIRFDSKLVLITLHRRENHGPRLESILIAIRRLAAGYSDHQFVLPVHPNPNVKDRIQGSLTLLR